MCGRRVCEPQGGEPVSGEVGYRPGQEGVLGLTPTPGTPNPGLGSVPPDGGPAVEPPHQLPESLLTSRLHH